MDSASLAEVKAWDLPHYPHDPLGNARADLELFTVNSPSRIHYNYSRSNWRGDQGHPHDRLFKLADPSPPRRTRYVLFNPSVQGRVDLPKDGEGNWKALILDGQSRATNPQENSVA